ncbi:hypothetical protein [Halorientalis marina]|uniref:hypothetical protein n=1 Tax=Halorientalis marina TaxID=2931976 RepID=UPI001FF4A042|nr:hypothetical protein [Halorientalis marina]
MSSEASDASTDATAQQSESSARGPSLTVVGTGPATFTRQVSDEASILAEHDTVELTIEREVYSAAEFETIVDPTFEGTGPTVCKPLVVDGLIDEHAMEGYQRSEIKDDWTLKVTGTVADWKQLILDLVPDLHRRSSDEGAAVRRLWDLAADGVTNDGAVLAALDLIDQHDIETRREKLTDLLTDGGDAE